MDSILFGRKQYGNQKIEIRFIDMDYYEKHNKSVYPIDKKRVIRYYETCLKVRVCSK